MSKKVSEAEIEKYFVKCVEERLGGVALKLEVKSRRGWPDRLAILPKFIYLIELKAEWGRLSALQTKRLDRLTELGCGWAVLNSKKQIDEWVVFVAEATEKQQRLNDAFNVLTAR